MEFANWSIIKESSRKPNASQYLKGMRDWPWLGQIFDPTKRETNYANKRGRPS
mgnify:CR=1 FL=1